MSEKNKPCPCGLDKTYDECCGRFIEGRVLPTHPEELMRSRYTAFTLADASYLRRTMKGPMLKSFDAASTKAWAASVDWTGLEVTRSELSGNKGVVAFTARFTENGKPGEIVEVSEFYRQGNKWYYTGKV